MKDGLEKKHKLSLEILLPCIHFLSSFFYEWTILQWKPEKITVTARAKDLTYSDTFERVMEYGLAKLFAALIIFLLWKMVFYFIHNFRKDKELIFFALLFLFGTACFAVTWPNLFYYDVDNYITYTYAIRLYPEYWHNAYTSILYTASFMTVPHPFAICFLQWTLFFFNMVYAYKRLKNSPCMRRFTWPFLLLVFIVPRVLLLINDPYRTELYSLVCIYYVFSILMDALEGKTYSNAKLVCLAFLSALLAVWRTEGIILGTLGFLVILFFVNRCSLKKHLVFLALYAVAFLIVSFPQKVGDLKYYGSDYAIINSFPSLHNILNRADSNLSYPGAEEDLAAIAAVVPIEAIQVYDMDGYRRYNVMNGNVDINQSITSHETGKRYVKAFYRIVLHNPVTYLRTQWNMLMVVYKLSDYYYSEKPSVELSMEYEPWTFPAWESGILDLYGNPAAKPWIEYGKRIALAGLVEKVWWTTEGIMIRIKAYGIILIIIPLVECFIVLRELIRFFKAKDKKKALRELGPACMAIVLLGQYAAIVLVMPAGQLVYFHALYFCSIFLEIVYFGWRRNYEKI